MKTRELWIGDSTAQAETGEEYTCDYILLIDEEEMTTWEQYGLRVTLRQTGESDEVRGITPIATQALQLGERLCRNTVTPYTLREIIEDWL